MYDELIEALRLCVKYGKAQDALENAEQAADAIEELTRENESLAKSVNEASEILRKRWIPVTERLPERCNFYIVADFGDVREAYCNSDGVWFSQGNKLKGVTHWMPLPEPPTKEKES